MFLLSLTAPCQVGAFSLKAGLYTYKRHAGDGLQRPLVPRSRFPPRLMPGVGLPLSRPYIEGNLAGVNGVLYDARGRILNTDRYWLMSHVVRP